MNIQLDDKTVEALSGQAAARGLSLEAYLRALAAGGDSEINATLSVAESERLLDELADGNRRLPTLPEAFSRADVYGADAD